MPRKDATQTAARQGKSGSGGSSIGGAANAAHYGTGRALWPLRSVAVSVVSGRDREQFLCGRASGGEADSVIGVTGGACVSV